MHSGSIVPDIASLIFIHTSEYLHQTEFNHLLQQHNLFSNRGFTKYIRYYHQNVTNYLIFSFSQYGNSINKCVYVSLIIRK